MPAFHDILRKLWIVAYKSNSLRICSHENNIFFLQLHNNFGIRL
ncbi:hypothetical protein CLORY_15270 [Clostridium oryzae]|uniref:Uncharacterized protein n=1 Tax=Clostridium oryzae TaxID=1450648 RepID=A0A1V4ISM0_9CLOT|nr:hypothetical protein CLORY_15270 [Clostridium oryzae]